MIEEAAAIGRIVEEVDWLVLEDKVAQAAVLLFETHKKNKKLWFKVKFTLLKQAENHSQLFIVASLIEVAEKDLLSQSFHVVPGLFTLSRQDHENI